MFCDINYPAHLSPYTLDNYLERGWFRMGQSMFTTSFLFFNNTLFNAIWLRYDLQTYNLRNSGKQILKLNKDFRVEIGPLTFSIEKNTLYNKYRSQLPFSIAHSLQALLLDDGSFSIFNSMEVCVYDNSKLIAVGVFDMGADTSQGIINFFDPAYKKFSLGKFLILQKILFLQTHNLTFFYPGYFAPGYPLFDYKTELSTGEVEYYDIAKNQWRSLNAFEINQAPLEKIHQKLTDLSKTEIGKSLKLEVCHYKFYDVKLFREYAIYDLLNTPFIIPLSPLEMHKELVAIYNVQKECYQIAICCHVFEINMPKQKGVFSTYFLRVEDVIFESKDQKDLSNYIFHNNLHFKALF
jgi:leucyl-tRNA---protein transferase